MRPHPNPIAVVLAAAFLSSSPDASLPGGAVCHAFLSSAMPRTRPPPGIDPRRASTLLPIRRPRRPRPSLSPLAASASPSGKTRPPPLPREDDPFLLLGLDPRNPTADVKEIKRAYRKRAMQYHPDVVLGPESTAEERDEASRDFARINAAYEMLSGGGKASAGTGGGSDGAKAKASSGPYNYQPPHRRKSGYASSPGRSANWEDFMPNYDEEDAKYDADGDSFGAIFSDILTGAAGYAAGAAGGGGIMGDFIDFLERNVDGFESGYDDDKSLSRLLTYGSFEEVAGEMDETDILVSSLETKLGTVENELMQVRADLKVAVKFSEKLDLEERSAELQAREKVVKGYLKKGKKRLIRLRERYKQLIVEGRGGRGYDAGSTGGSASGAGYTSRGAARPDPPSSSATSSRPPSTSPTAPPTEKGWRNEGFSGGYGGRSSSSRRGGRRGRNADDTPPSPGAERRASQRNGESTESGGGASKQQQRRSQSRGDTESGRGAGTNSSGGGKPSPRQTEPWVPPHRRTQSSAERAAQDKKRLRELKVDDDFERLKREMGL